MQNMQSSLASLMLQISLYFNGWYLVFLYLVELGLLLYKGLVLPYPARNFWPELILFLVLVVIDGIRLFLGVKGNLTRRKLPLLLSLLFLLPVFIGYLYFILWQTYVLTLELVLFIIAYIGIGIQLILSLVVLWILQRSTTSS